MSISSLLVDCLSHFNALVAREDLIAQDVEVPKSLWEDELGRLRVWAANIGAHQTGQSSLDYRLRDASHIKDQIVRLLEALQRLLVDLDEVSTDPPQETDDQLSDEEETTDLEHIYNGLVEVIGSLFRMSMLIRRPARHDRLLGTKKEDLTTFEPYDRQHVLEKYPQADGIIADRLGSAISRRRADLKYRERHHAKLSQGIGHTNGHQESHSTHDRESTVFSETVATEYKETNIQFDETGSQSGLSQTSYAPTLLEGGGTITVPPPPKESANEQPFECPYCFFITTIKSKRSWARHVFRDIMPYTCIFAGCSTPNRLYDSRREWYQHLTSSHTLPTSASNLHECPLCGEADFSIHTLERHLGRHLEELALFALPRIVGDEEFDSDRSRHSTDASPYKESHESSGSEVSDQIQPPRPIEANSVGTIREEVGAGLSKQDVASRDEEGDFIIKCICTYPDDDGNTVFCERCETWQHIECYYPDKAVPEVHLCVDCEPRRVDRKGAKERQTRIQEQLDYRVQGGHGETSSSEHELVEVVEECSPERGSSARGAETTSGFRTAGLNKHYYSSSEDSLATASGEEETSRPSRFGGKDLATSGGRPEGKLAVQGVDRVAEKRRETLSAETERTTSDAVAKQMAGMNEGILNSSNEFVRPGRLPDAKKLRGTDQSHLQQTLLEEIPGNKSVLGSSKEFSIPLPKSTVEDYEKYGPLFGIESSSTQGESGAGGDEKREGALSKIKRLFGMGSKQESSRDGLVVTDKVEQSDVAQGDVPSRSGSDEYFRLPTRKRPIDSESDLKPNPDSHRTRRDSLDLPIGPSMLHANRPIIIEDGVRDRRRDTDLTVTEERVHRRVNEEAAAAERAYRAARREPERRREDEEKIGRDYRAAVGERERQSEAEEAYWAREGERQLRRRVEDTTLQPPHAALRERETHGEAQEEDRRVEMELRGRLLRERDLADRERRLAERERVVVEPLRRVEADDRAEADAEARSRQRSPPAHSLHEQPSALSDRGAEVVRQAQEDARRRREESELLVPEIGRRRDVRRRSGSVTIFDDDDRRRYRRFQ